MSDVADADLNTDEEEEAEDGGSPAKKWLNKKIIIIAAAVLLVLGAGGAGIYFLGLIPTGEGTEEAAPPPPKPAFFYELPEMTVNLASTGARPQYLKVRIALEASDRNVIDAIKPVEPRILDAFQVYLRELRSSDLEGSRSVFRLKEELLRRVNLSIHPYEVDRILFNEIIVQ
ncbi:MAG: flagellar basal body-associated FliL family protein [Hyphomicrobiales bacterium]|nr:flagellar basal body-associated FliL family protein [Hyphomicrobiales bacterium]